jgi:hypothetical protein
MSAKCVKRAAVNSSPTVFQVSFLIISAPFTLAEASSPLPTDECVSRIQKYQSRLLDLKLCLAVGREEWSANARCRGQQIAVPACRMKWQVVFSFNMLLCCVSILYQV